MRPSSMSTLHRVMVRVRFDKPCTRAEAVLAIRDNIHGEFYPTFYRDKAPELFRIKSVAAVPKRRYA